MDNNLKTVTEKLGGQMVKEFMKAKAYKDDNELQTFKLLCTLMDGIVQLYDDVEVLKKENEELKKKLEKES